MNPVRQPTRAELLAALPVPADPDQARALARCARPTLLHLAALRASGPWEITHVEASPRRGDCVYVRIAAARAVARAEIRTHGIGRVSLYSSALHWGAPREGPWTDPAEHLAHTRYTAACVAAALAVEPAP